MNAQNTLLLRVIYGVFLCALWRKMNVLVSIRYITVLYNTQILNPTNSTHTSPIRANYKVNSLEKYDREILRVDCIRSSDVTLNMTAVSSGMFLSVVTQCHVVSLKQIEWHIFVINQIKMKASQSIFIKKCYFNFRSALWSIWQSDPDSIHHTRPPTFANLSNFRLTFFKSNQTFPTILFIFTMRDICVSELGHRWLG